MASVFFGLDWFAFGIEMRSIGLLKGSIRMPTGNILIRKVSIGIPMGSKVVRRVSVGILIGSIGI